MAVALTAVAISLGGTSYAAVTITGKNVRNGSLTGADVKNSSLTSGDVRDGSLLLRDFKVGQVAGGTGTSGAAGGAGAPGGAGTAGATGATGAPGPVGPAGGQGPPGPSAAFSRSSFPFVTLTNSGGLPTAAQSLVAVDVPAGSYAITAKGLFNPSGNGQAYCQLIADGDVDGVIVQGQANGEWTPFALQTPHTFAAPGTIHLACSDNNGATHWQAGRLGIQATRVDQITQSAQ
jgi:hypothetical protein